MFKDPGNWLGTIPQTDAGGTRESVKRVMQFIGLLPDDSDDHLINGLSECPATTWCAATRTAN